MPFTSGSSEFLTNLDESEEFLYLITRHEPKRNGSSGRMQRNSNFESWELMKKSFNDAHIRLGGF